jgi:sugar O-acyltransferase (sialic acid O-acetyltransferase NeuD family)
MIYKDIKIGLIGYGSVGKQLYNTLLESGYEKSKIYIFADDIELEEEQNRFLFNDFKKDRFRELHLIPTLGYLSSELRFTILEYLIENDHNIFSFIHSTAFVSQNAKIGRGVIIYPLCNIDQGVCIGDGCIILNSSVIAHDTCLGKCCYVAPGVCISGFVKIEELCFVGTGAILANKITVGRKSTIAMGTSLTKSIAEGSFVIGNPFQFKDKILLY